MNWFNSLSGSRARAKELETENASLVAARDSAAAALTAERDSNTAALAALKTEIATLTEANVAMSKDVESAIADAAKAKADADKATSDFDKKVKEAASRGAQEINASLGVPPVLQTGEALGVKGANTMARSVFSKLSPQGQSEFCAKGGKITEG